MPIYQPGDTVRLATTFMVGVVLTDPTTVSLTVTDPAGTPATYTWAGATVIRDSVGAFRKDIVASTAGIWSWKWTGTGAAAGVDEGTFTVERSLASAGLLCSVDDVRAFLQKPGADLAQDDVISVMIARASSVIASYTGREFAPMGTLTRRFRVDGGLVDLTPFDLRAATIVSLNPESASPTVLAATTGYDLRPYGASGATYRVLRVAGQYGSDSAFYGDFGHSLIDITGEWGMASTPEDVRHACVVTVGLWMRRDVQAFTATFNITEDRLERPQALPSSVIRVLDNYRQIGVA